MDHRSGELGIITRGSLLEGIEMKLSPNRSVEDIKAGKFVVIEGEKHLFFSMITDVRLEVTNPQILTHPPSRENTLLRQVLSGTSTYATVILRPMLALEREEGSNLINPTPQPVKTIPIHFALVYEAGEEDVNRIFGDEALDRKYFNIGKPLDMDTPVCLNLDRFVERSNGIFGKTGTGKTFLTRLVLCGLIKNEKAVNVIFDTHNEYGWGARKETGGSQQDFVKGLKQIFGNRVAIFTLDPDSSRRRKVQADHEVLIGYDQIAVEDVIPLQEELNLHPTAMEAAYSIWARYKSDWLDTLLERGEEDIQALADELRAHPESLAALYRKLRRFRTFKFLIPKTSEDIIQKIMEYIDKGIHIVLEFGKESSMLCYLLVANIITRRIHELYVKRTEEYLATQNPADKPKQLVITIEEAHKFLNPRASKQTIFGTIARELRKYYVSLLVVDQRPSGIDDEILSQIGTKIVALLDDERDIQAVLTGVSNPTGLRSVLASLDSKQQALILGHAVPMPVVIRSRDYDEQFYKDMGSLTEKEREEKVAADIEALFG
jgi:hypothetical protein